MVGLKKENHIKQVIPRNKLLRRFINSIRTDGMYARFLGYHECDFCDYVNVELGATTIMIAYKEKVYICPALIIHYMEKHNYCPPDEFVEAVLNYNHQYAMTYFNKIKEKKFLKNGGKEKISLIKEE